MQKFFLALFVFCCTLAQAQYKVTFTITHYPSYHSASSTVYIAGSFNNWNPGAQSFQLQNNRITIDVPKGVIEYKFTRGSWDKAEAADAGTSIDNRRLHVEKDTVIPIDIAQWADHFGTKGKRSTAGKNVRVIDTAFYMPQLNRHRRIWIYLPDSYATSRQKYPVLYMHDGQNVFDEATAFSGEWGVDEAMDSLGPAFKECIVVGIDNGGEKRLNEYSPFDMEKYGKGEGDQYVDFIVKTLKPFIQKNYRVKRCHKHQYIAGSSMGGLISLYAILKYPKEFGGAGVFSPAFWITPQIKEAVEARGSKVKGKIYFYAGKQESEEMVPDMLAVFERLNRLSKATMTTVIRTEGKHAEATWRQEFPLFIEWLFSH